MNIYILLFTEPYNDLQVDEKENDGKLSFDTFDLTNIMNCSALMASPDIDQDNPITSENGTFHLVNASNLCYRFIYFIDTEKIIQDQQRIINKTLGLEIIGSDIITSDDIMISSTPSKPNLKVSSL